MHCLTDFVPVNDCSHRACYDIGCGTICADHLDSNICMQLLHRFKNSAIITMVVHACTISSRPHVCRFEWWQSAKQSQWSSSKKLMMLGTACSARIMLRSE